MPRQPQARYGIGAEDRTSEGLGQAEGRLRQFGAKLAGGMRSVARRVAKPLATIGAALTALGTAFVKASQQIRELSNAGSVIGATAGEMAVLQSVAEQLGTDLNTLSDNVGELRRKGLEALEEPTGKAAELFRDLGIEAEKFVKLDIQAQMQDAAKALARFEGSRKQTLGSRLLGESPEDLRLFSDPKRLQRAFGRAQAAGIGAGLNAEVKNAEKLAGAWDIFTSQLGTMFQRGGTMAGKPLTRALNFASENVARVLKGPQTNLLGPRERTFSAGSSLIDPRAPKESTQQTQVVLLREIVSSINRNSGLQ